MSNASYGKVKKEDPEIYKPLNSELERQRKILNMIPSENYVSESILQATGSILMNKYSEGYPGERYYQGMKNVDEIENIAIRRAKKLFDAEHANVQPLSGSPANQAIYYGLLEPGDKIMGLRLDMGGHLSHGHKASFSSNYYESCSYVLDEESKKLNMEKVRQKALEEEPDLIISGFTAYPREVPFEEFHEIAKEVGAYSMADISHIAGLIAGGVHESPLPFTDAVMTTTHKTLRGPRGAMILCKEKFADSIDEAVFPGLQGGPHQNKIAATAIALKKAMSEDFNDYADQVIKNAKKLGKVLKEEGIDLVSGGTDTHLLLLDLTSIEEGIGKEVAVALERSGICVNMNAIPYDPSDTLNPSGIRLGSPILTTRGMEEEQMDKIGKWISEIIHNCEDKGLQKEIKGKVTKLCKEFPFY